MAPGLHIDLWKKRQWQQEFFEQRVKEQDVLLLVSGLYCGVASGLPSTFAILTPTIPARRGGGSLGMPLGFAALSRAQVQ